MKNLIIAIFVSFLCVGCADSYSNPSTPPVYSMDGLPHELTATGDNSQISFIVQPSGRREDPGGIRGFECDTIQGPYPPHGSSAYKSYNFYFQIIRGNNKLLAVMKPPGTFKVFKGKLLDGHAYGLVTYYYDVNWGNAPIYITCSLLPY